MVRGGRRTPGEVRVDHPKPHPHAVAGLIAVFALLAAGCSNGGPKSAGTTTSVTVSRGSLAPAVTTTATTAAGPTVATTSTTTSSLNRTVMASAGGLSVTLAVTPVKAKVAKPISFNLTAQEGEAHGALEYQIFYGDGKTDQNPAPQYCVTAASLAHQTWALTHHYASAGTYMVILTAWANCTRDRARTQAVTVTIT